MNIRANDPNRKSWVEIPENSDFTIQNLPFGVFRTNFFEPRVGVAIGNKVLDLYSLAILGYLKNSLFEPKDFLSDKLNTIMKYGKEANRELRNRVSDLLEVSSEELQNHDVHINQVFFEQDDVEMLMPVEVGDYTDFYSSRQHATNVGIMFRDPENALLPNWLHIPVGYHGRASSIVVSGKDVHSPMGQTFPKDADKPTFGPSRLVDFELEMAFITFDGKPMGENITTSEADEFIFGMVIFNDWSARDIQKWEYVPLGPFLAKNFASSISPWVVTLDALEPFRVEGEKQDPEVFDYLKFEGNKNIDINLETYIKPEGGNDNLVCESNYKYMYWNMAQQLAHHTVNGCNIRCGDMMASGTISGPEDHQFGSMLEISWQGTKPIKLDDGSERKFIQDNDEVTMKAFAEKDGVRVGFGEVRTKLLPVK